MTPSDHGVASNPGIENAGLGGLRPVVLRTGDILLRPQDARRLRPRARGFQPLASLAAVLPALLLLTTSKPLAAGSTAGGGPPIGSTAPAFALPDTRGSLLDLDRYRGQVVMLNFWAFWCDTWKAEMPSLSELAGRQDELGFRMLAISVDGTRLSVFRSHTQGGQVPFPVLLDVGGQVTARYHVRHVPTVVIVDRRGLVRYTAYGYPGNEAILSVLRRLDSARGRTTGG